MGRRSVVVTPPLIVPLLAPLLLPGCGSGADPNPTSDTRPPSAVAVAVGDGAAVAPSRAVTLALEAADDVGVTGYCAAESDAAPAPTDPCWVAVPATPSYVGAAPFTLSAGNGPKTVSVWFRDAAGNRSAAARDEITLAAGSGKIAFASGRDGNLEIYLMRADGGAPAIRLTDHPAADWGPRISPDGTKIAFVSGRDGDADIYLMNADGSGIVNLTDNRAHDEQPAFSPDGSRIAFVSYRDGNFEIYVMNVDGSGQTNLTRTPAWETAPRFSPDGGRLAFSTNRDGDWEIYVMAADGSEAVRLTAAPGPDTEPAWSPDGSRIAFAGRRGPSLQPEIYLMNADGSGEAALTDDPAHDRMPAFSPDGTRIAYTSARQGDLGEIRVIQVDGANPTDLTRTAGANIDPDWAAGDP